MTSCLPDRQASGARRIPEIKGNSYPAFRKITHDSRLTTHHSRLTTHDSRLKPVSLQKILLALQSAVEQLPENQYRVIEIEEIRTLKA
jgi:hypothetical protein